MARTGALIALALLFQVSALRIEKKKPDNKKHAAKLLAVDAAADAEEMSPELLNKNAEAALDAEVQNADASNTIPEGCVQNQAQTHGGKKNLTAVIMARKPECRDPWSKTQVCTSGFQIPGYRIGDMYRLLSPDFSERVLMPYMKFHFPGTIGEKYINAHKKPRDSKALLSVIDGADYANFEKPPKDALVVHFRLGDILHFKNFAISKKHMRGEDYYMPKIEKAKALGIKEAVLITGDHQLQQMANVDAQHKEDAKQSDKEVRDEMKKFAELFEKAGMKVTTRINYNPDCDLIYMSNAKYFAKGAGQFTLTIAEMVALKGGEVL